MRPLRAFTLVEVVVAMSVSLLLIVALLQLFSATTTSWQRGEAQIDAFREARGALQSMARDISTTLQPSSVQADGTSNTAQPLLPTLVLNRYPDAAPPRDASAESINEEAYVLTSTMNLPTPTPSSSPGTLPTPPPSTGGIQRQTDLCAVGYFCQWMPDIAPTTAAQARAPRAFALMRQYLNGDGTSARIQAGSLLHGGGGTSATSQTPFSFLDLYERASLVPGASTGATTPPVGTATQLAAYIWDLKFRIDTNTAVTTDGESPAPPSAAPGTPGLPTDHSTPKPRLYDGSTLPYPSTLPAYVEIRFKALSNNAGRRLEGNTSVSPKDWIAPASGTQPSAFYSQIVVPSTQQFVLRVPLLNANPAPTP